MADNMVTTGRLARIWSHLDGKIGNGVLTKGVAAVGSVGHFSDGGVVAQPRERQPEDVAARSRWQCRATVSKRS